VDRVAAEVELRRCVLQGFAHQEARSVGVAAVVASGPFLVAGALLELIAHSKLRFGRASVTKMMVPAHFAQGLK